MPAGNISDQAIFEVARKIDSREVRRAYLSQVCGEDAAAAQRIGALLRAYDESGSFLESPSPDVGATLDQPLAAPHEAVIGPYKLLQQIGEGGMGAVYMAEQTHPVQRKVALKLIKPGLDNRQVIARFEVERQALALMDHPNIAKVLDAGTVGQASSLSSAEGNETQRQAGSLSHGGQPYFVMELVHGVPITKYCDEHRLTPQQRLELFVPVCHAIQHAHQKGIIHRDIKPSNVLIAQYDGKPVPKVIDFGVAKATGSKLTDKTMFTEFGSIVGTLEYMSPEQADRNQLDIDTRSDIYSLGVLLYELLTGTTPLDRKRLKSAAILELLRIIKEEEPQRPSTRLSTTDELPSIAANRNLEPKKLSGLVRGELDWIVMKALEKDRNRRYETANGFAMDIQRYLADEHVLACPPSAGYRLRKFARRNRAVLAMVAIVTLALLLGVVGTTWQAVRAIQQRDRAVEAEKDAGIQRNLAQQRADEAEEARSRAEANSRQARQAVDDMYTQVAEKWLAHQPNLEPLQREFLEKALRFYAEFAQQQSTDPAVRFETARAYRRVAEIQHRLGQREESEEAFLRAIDQLQALADEFPATPAYRHEQAQALHKLGVNIGDTRSHLEEEKAHRRALVLETQLAAEFPAVPEYRQNLGRGYCFLGRVLRHRANTLAEAEQAFHSALTIQRTLVAEFPAAAEYRWQLADSHLGLGENQRSMGRHQESLQERLKAAALLEKLMADFPDIPDYRTRLADVYYWLGVWSPHQEAEKWLRKALPLQEKQAADFPAVTDYQYDFFRSLSSLGRTLLEDTRAAEAELPLRRAVEIAEKLVAESPKTHYYRSRLAATHMVLGDVLRATDKVAEAEDHYLRSISLYEGAIAEFPDVGDSRRQVVFSYQRLAQLLKTAGREREAAEFYRRFAESCLSENAGTLNNVAWRLVTSRFEDERDAKLAVELAQKAVELAPQAGHIWNTLGVAHYRVGDWPAAITALEKSMELRKGGDCNDWFFLAMARWQLGEKNKAREFYDQAVDWMDKNQPNNEELLRFRTEATELLKSNDDQSKP